MTDKQLLTLAGGMKRLIALRINETQVTGAGLATLADKLALRMLDVHGLSLTDDDLPALTRMSSLAQLDVTATKLTEQGLAQLRKKLSRCQIICDQNKTPE